MASSAVDFDEVESIIEKEGAKGSEVLKSEDGESDSELKRDRSLSSGAENDESAAAGSSKVRKTSNSRSRSRSISRPRSREISAGGSQARDSVEKSRDKSVEKRRRSSSETSESRSDGGRRNRNKKSPDTRRRSRESSKRRSRRSRHDRADRYDKSDRQDRDRSDRRDRADRDRTDRNDRPDRYNKHRNERRDRRDRRGNSPKRWERPRHRDRDHKRSRRDDSREKRQERGKERDEKEERQASASPDGMQLAFEASRKRFEQGTKMANDEDERRRKELEEARRDDMTVFVLNLPLKANERDVWKFFSDHAGKVRDIQVIRDNQSGKSKGVGYVEFYSQESVLKGLALSGHMILGNVIKVQASQAEKNRQAKQAKIQAAEAAESGPTKLFIGNLIGPLEAITDEELRQLFNPFGEVVSSEINKDPYTQKSRGYGFVQYRKATDAREAMSALNGFEIAGQSIKVGFAAADQQSAVSALASLATATLNAPSALVANAVQQLQRAAAEVEGQESERLDDEGGGLLSGPTRRIALMQKLQRPDALNLGGRGLGMNDEMVAPMMTCNLCIGPLFTAQDVEEEGRGLLDEIADDVREECSKCGKLVSIFVKRTQIDGKAWVKFATPAEAHTALMKLNGRSFGDNTVEVQFVSDVDWENFMKN